MQTPWRNISYKNATEVSQIARVRALQHLRHQNRTALHWIPSAAWSCHTQTSLFGGQSEWFKWSAIFSFFSSLHPRFIASFIWDNLFTQGPCFTAQSAAIQINKFDWHTISGDLAGVLERGAPSHNSLASTSHCPGKASSTYGLHSRFVRSNRDAPSPLPTNQGRTTSGHPTMSVICHAGCHLLAEVQGIGGIEGDRRSLLRPQF